MNHDQREMTDEEMTDELMAGVDKILEDMKKEGIYIDDEKAWPIVKIRLACGRGVAEKNGPPAPAQLDATIRATPRGGTGACLGSSPRRTLLFNTRRGPRSRSTRRPSAFNLRIRPTVCWNHNPIHFLEDKEITPKSLCHELVHLREKRGQGKKGSERLLFTEKDGQV